MKLKRMDYVKGIIVALLFAFMVTNLTGCDSFEKTSYKTLKTMAATYKAAMDMAHVHYINISDAQEKATFWKQVAKYSDPVRASLKAAKEACAAYSRAKHAYDAAVAVSETGPNATEKEAASASLDGLLAKADAAQAAASAALQSVDVDGLLDAVKTLIGQF